MEELETGKSFRINLPDVRALDWIILRRPTSSAVLPLVSQLGPGETEVLMLALESPGAVVVLDDGLGRFVAQTIGIKSYWHTGNSTRRQASRACPDGKPAA